MPLLTLKPFEALGKFLKCSPQDLVKILFFTYQEEDQEKSIAVLCRGDDEVNPIKVKNGLGLLEVPELASPEKVQQIAGASPGSCGPYSLKTDIPIYLDSQLKGLGHFITGANKDGFHVKNVQPERDFKVQSYGDFCYARPGDASPDGKGVLQERRGIEVGHLFYLSDTYSRKMNLSYLNQKGKKEFVEMGCYGLGVTRTLQALIEQSHDKDGCIWPLSVAPCAVHICLLDVRSEPVLKALTEILGIIKDCQLDYFIDDREERPGVKFKDADLLGLPLRINLGERDLKNSQVECVVRKSKSSEKLSISALKKFIQLKIN